MSSTARNGTVQDYPSGAPKDCEGCVHIVDFAWKYKQGEAQCSVFTEFLPGGWLNEDGTCQAYKAKRKK